MLWCIVVLIKKTVLGLNLFLKMVHDVDKSSDNNSRAKLQDLLNEPSGVPTFLRPCSYFLIFLLHQRFSSHNFSPMSSFGHVFVNVAYQFWI